ncbi:16S rRNA (uracil(1498)-N(3))-methyltransferase [Falsarthrobacter nasiphocae]|uniref:Ribosomal RNA small subunit methyltransferase E n=1 Tax=Falsarthrobacter nasiphocae TaxID=189863 RepID=A0AAE3YF48_9MICC|nr:16S rRNA (uracil(1498)-N(3))-methyltransferase [Falsarthrobacter nasiphocae]MDR6891072.1 16S rRNA (uracil1498-N3)-methyltransferase [Falsarthrobacter nasiphocae]
MTLHQFAAGRSLAGAELGGRVVVEGGEAKHALTVHRLADGAHVRISDGEGRVVVGPVSGDSMRGKEPRLVVVAEEILSVPRLAPPVRVVQALAKGDRDLASIETCTELGAAWVTPWEAERSVARWPQAKAEKSAAKWRNTLEAAAKQSRNPWTPLLEPLAQTKVLAGRVREAVASGALVVVLHEDAPEGLVDVAWRNADAWPVPEVWLIVGPEGGISPRETEALTGAGAALAGLGPRVLRSSSAAPVAMAALQAVTEALELAGLGAARRKHSGQAPKMDVDD